MIANPFRRRWLKTTSLALAAIPVVTGGRAMATTNATLRVQLKYQSVPLDGKSCSSCLEFIPGKTETDSGGCKKMPGDDEISPNGYCTQWNTL